MAHAAGVDVGSTQTKAVIVDEHGHVAGRALIETGPARKIEVAP